MLFILHVVTVLTVKLSSLKEFLPVDQQFLGFRPSSLATAALILLLEAVKDLETDLTSFQLAITGLYSHCQTKEVSKDSISSIVCINFTYAVHLEARHSSFCPLMEAASGVKM